MILRAIFAVFVALMAFTACEHYAKNARLERAQAEASEKAAADRDAAAAAVAARENNMAVKFQSQREAVLAEVKRLMARKEWRLARQELEPWQKLVSDDSEFRPLVERVDKEVKAIEAREDAIAKKELAAIKRKQGVAIGMTEADVMASQWGRPEKVNRTQTKYGTREQWVYPNSQYLYLENGKVTGIQNSR
jgi:hypothetical protein